MRLQNDFQPKDHQELWELIKDVAPADPAVFLRPMRNSEFNRNSNLPLSARPPPGLVFKFITPELHTALPEWKWYWLFRFKESPLSQL
eukprot:12933681-Alexandrium_andersonii.AAC.1